MVLERHFHAGLAAVVRHLLERLDAVAAGTWRARRSWDSREVATGRRGDARAAAIHAHRFRAEDLAAPSSHFLATSMPALRFSASSSQMSRGALLEMCWHLVPVAAILSASFSEPLLAGGAGRVELLRDARRVPTKTGTSTYMLSSATSPNRPEKRSMWVTPGKVSLVNCGKSSMVISPYFFFISSAGAVAAEAGAALEELTEGPGVGGDAVEFFLFGERPRGGGLGREGEAGQAGGLEEITAIEVGHASSF